MIYSPFLLFYRPRLLTPELQRRCFLRFQRRYYTNVLFSHTSPITPCGVSSHSLLPLKNPRLRPFVPVPHFGHCHIAHFVIQARLANPGCGLTSSNPQHHSVVIPHT